MRSNTERGRLKWLLAASACQAAFVVSGWAHADDLGTIAPGSATATSLGVSSGQTPETGLAVGPFLVYPQFFLGAVYNDNLFATPTKQVGGFGLRLTPSLSAVDDQGLHKTSVNVTVDGQFYPGSTPSGDSAAGRSSVAALATVEHVWTPTPDVTVDAAAGYQRQSGFFATTLGTATSFVSTSQTNVSLIKQYSDAISGTAYVEKRFSDQWFVRAGGGAQGTYYETPVSGTSSQQSGWDYNAFLRTGFYILPSVNAFAEVGADFKRYRDSWYDTNAQRVIVGLSSDLVGLFRGEAYAGYQWQQSVNGGFGAVSAPTFGATLYYYPTQLLTLAASLSRSFGTAAVQSTGAAYVGAPTTSTWQARLAADYKVAEYWSATAHAGWGKTSASNTTVVDATWMVGGGFNYSFWRNISVTLDYEYLRTLSNTATLPGYADNVVSAGLTYRY